MYTLTYKKLPLNDVICAEEVTYIKGFGHGTTPGQYIYIPDFANKPASEYTYEIKVSHNGYLNENQCIFVHRSTGVDKKTNSAFALGLNQADPKIQSDFANNTTSHIKTSFVPVEDTPYILKKSKNLTYINNTLVATHPAATFNSIFGISLFASYNTNKTSGTPDGWDNYLNGKIYYFKVWDENDDLVLDLHPVIDSNNSVGMYDTVSGKIFLNSGEGIFACGSRTGNVFIGKNEKYLVHNNHYDVPFEISCNGNDGYPETYIKNTVIGAKFGTISEPERYGYKFLGWDYSDDKIVEEIQRNYILASSKVDYYNRNIYAHWLSAVNLYIDSYYEFPGGWYEFPGGAIEHFYFKNHEIDVLPECYPSDPSYSFAGWYDENGNNYYEGQIVPGDYLNLYAHYEYIEQNIQSILWDHGSGYYGHGECYWNSSNIYWSQYNSSIVRDIYPDHLNGYSQYYDYDINTARSLKFTYNDYYYYDYIELNSIEIYQSIQSYDYQYFSINAYCWTDHPEYYPYSNIVIYFNSYETGESYEFWSGFNYYDTYDPSTSYWRSQYVDLNYDKNSRILNIYYNGGSYIAMENCPFESLYGNFTIRIDGAYTYSYDCNAYLGAINFNVGGYSY